MYSKYQSVCANLLAKARLRGVSIILPVDLVVGDECILPDHFSKYSHTTDKDSRDEGGDYEGDTTIVTCESHGTVISGYPLDLGPVSCQNIRSLISQHHLHLNWGTVGCCELSSFQSGQRSLVESSTSKPSTSSITHNLIIGESTVEWWSRISDSEGEFEGDLIKKGVVDLMCRDSSTFSSTISHLPSRHISTILRRLPNLDEWDYLTALRKEEEDPEEEEEEEEDD